VPAWGKNSHPTSRVEVGANVRPGMVAHSPDYVARVIRRALRTAEERIDIPHGPEQPHFPETPVP